MGKAPTNLRNSVFINDQLLRKIRDDLNVDQNSYFQIFDIKVFGDSLVPRGYALYFDKDGFCHRDMESHTLDQLHCFVLRCIESE